MAESVLPNEAGCSISNRIVGLDYNKPLDESLNLP
jgi:hypothetical protein